ncbi:MAG: hypothetical protein IT184_07805 [Acidobacteria bacterium]|nr:hypothetical protein [Acidobacteriota bacterium]
MSERKYRQRGYQDVDRRDRAGLPAERPKEPHDPRLPRDPRVPNVPGFKDVFRCARCGRMERPDVGLRSVCGQCGVALHACIQCASFDSGARFECRQTIAARVSPKDAANDCPLFAPRVSIERETGSTPSSSSSSARKAFDDLFKL